MNRVAKMVIRGFWWVPEFYAVSAESTDVDGRNLGNLDAGRRSWHMGIAKP